MKPRTIAGHQAAAGTPTSMGRKIADIDRLQIHGLMPATGGGNHRFHTASISVKRPDPPVCRVGLVTNIYGKGRVVALACSPLETSDLCTSHGTRFLECFDLITSPLGGLRPMRAESFLTCKMPRPAIRIRSPFLRIVEFPRSLQGPRQAITKGGLYVELGVR
jgi:hypothetical protein